MKKSLCVYIETIFLYINTCIFVEGLECREFFKRLHYIYGVCNTVFLPQASLIPPVF